MSAWLRVSPTPTAFRHQVVSCIVNGIFPHGLAVTATAVGASYYSAFSSINYEYDAPHAMPAGEW